MGLEKYSKRELIEKIESLQSQVDELKSSATTDDSSSSFENVQVWQDLILASGYEFACRFLPDGTVTYANDAICEFFGLEREKVIGQNFSEYIPEEDRERILNKLHSLTPENPTEMHENLGTRFKGAKYWGVWINRAVFDDEGNVVEYVAIGRDISDWKDAEKALAESEERFRTLVENLGDAVFAHDLDGNLVLVNETACRFTGYTREELHGMTVADIDAESVERDDRKNFWLSLDEYESKILKASHKRKDGSTYRAEINLNRIDLDGRPIILAIARDVTAQSEITAALEEREEILNEAQEIAGMGSFVWDLRNDSLNWSRNMFKLAGLDPDSFKGNLTEAIADIIHPEDQEKINEQIRRMVKKKETWPMEFRVILKDKSTKIWRSGSRFIFDENGIPAKCIGVHLDLTDLKKTERSLREKTELLNGILNNISSIVVVKDTQFRNIVVNSEYEKYTGMSMRQLLGKTPLDIYDAEYGQEVYEDDLEVIESRQAKEKEIEREIDGKKRCFLMSKFPLYDDNKEIRGLCTVATDITSRKEAEDAVKSRHMLLEQIFSAIPDAVVYAGPDRKIEKVNPAFARKLGFTPEEAIGRETNMFYANQEDYRKQGKARYNINAPSLFEPYEIEYRRKDGEKFISETVGTPVKDAGGNTIGFLGIIRDVTDKKKAEEALKESQRFARAIAETTPSLTYIYDFEEDKNVWVNKMHQNVIGPALKNKDGAFDEKALKEIIHPDDLEKEIKRLYKIRDAETDICVESEFRAKTKTGKYRWFHDKTSVFKRDKNGKVKQIIGSIMDVTELKYLTEILRDQVDFAKVLLDTIPNPIYYKNIGGKYLGCNKAFEQFSGVKRKDIVGKTLYDFAPEDIAKKYGEQDKKLFESGGQQIIEQKSLDGNRRERDMIFYKATFNRAGNKPAGLIGVLLDITERRQMEQELLKAEKLESIGVLAGGIAHDFNNILVAILGNISLARMELDEDNELYHSLASAEIAAVRARDLTQQLLTFSKGGAPIKKIVDIKKTIRDSTEFTLHGSNVMCDYKIDPALKPVLIDEGQFSQVINNLVINAMQAMPEGGSLEITADNIEIDESGKIPLRQGEYLKISVADTGVGISQKHMSRIFDPFFTTKKRGSGLGLAGVYSIIKNHGGHINVDSKMGVGSTFNIFLPATTESPKARAETSDEIESGEGRILIMDDEKSILNLVRISLTKKGYMVDTALEGDEAANKYETAMKRGEPFDLAILDLTIPGGMGGKKTLERLKVIDPDVSAVVSSGYSNDPILSEYERYGFSECIVKPYKINELLRIVNKVLSQKKQASGFN